MVSQADTLVVLVLLVLILALTVMWPHFGRISQPSSVIELLSANQGSDEQRTRAAVNATLIPFSLGPIARAARSRALTLAPLGEIWTLCDIDAQNG